MTRILPGLLVATTLALTLLPTGPASAATLTTATGYRLEYAVRGQDAPGPLALIMLHGKNAPAADGPPVNLVRWAERVARAGFRVYVPAMPWSSRWDGTHEDASAAIDALIELAARDGKKVVLGGHSMGGMFTIIYRAASLPESVVGKFMSAPGHALDQYGRNAAFWSEIGPALRQARDLEAAGKGNDKARFEGRNLAGRRNIAETYETTPRIYLSFHDPERLPPSLPALRVTAVPVLWLVGSDDPLVNGSASRRVFERVPSHPKSSFDTLDGRDHATSLPATIDKLVPWLKSLATP